MWIDRNNNSWKAVTMTHKNTYVNSKTEFCCEICGKSAPSGSSLEDLFEAGYAMILGDESAYNVAVSQTDVISEIELPGEILPLVFCPHHWPEELVLWLLETLVCNRQILHEMGPGLMRDIINKQKEQLNERETK